MSKTPVLEVSGLTAGYGASPVVHEVDLRVDPGEVVTLLGSNGAGKTTTLHAITGLVKPSAGAIRYRGEEWAQGRPWTAAENGISLIAAERFTFAELTVDENLALGGYTVAPGAARERREQVLEMFPILSERLDQAAGTMSGGQQRMLSLGIALMSDPKLLLLDEPSLGLAPSVVDQLVERIADLARTTGMGVLMVEQNVGQVLHIADRAYVLRSGRIILEQPAQELLARDEWWDLF